MICVASGGFFRHTSVSVAQLGEHLTFNQDVTGSSPAGNIVKKKKKEVNKMDELLKKYPVALSISDVAEILNVTPATVRRHIKKNDLPHIKIGRLVRIPKDSLIDCLHGDQIPSRKEEK